MPDEISLVMKKKDLLLLNWIEEEFQGLSWMYDDGEIIARICYFTSFFKLRFEAGT